MQPGKSSCQRFTKRSTVRRSYGVAVLPEMSPFSLFMSVIGRTQALSAWGRYLLAMAIVTAVFALRTMLGFILPEQDAFLLPIAGVLICATLFDRGTGLLATVVSGAAADWLYLHPLHSLRIADPRQVAALGVFLAIGFFISLIIEGFQTALHGLKTAHSALGQTDRQRHLLLREFRHRTRNDLQSLVALLLLRARAAPSPAAQDGLREAAEHARALARVHTLLAQEALHEDDPTLVDSRSFVEGLAIELARTHSTEGLRPVALHATAESHPIDTERAIMVGLVLNECVTNALKYAFPDETPGKVQVRFTRAGEDFVLTIEDDGTGTAPDEHSAEPSRMRPLGTGLGTRLLRGMAAQLRGSFVRGPGEGGGGTRAVLQFPIHGPGMHTRRNAALV